MIGDTEFLIAMHVKFNEYERRAVRILKIYMIVMHCLSVKKVLLLIVDIKFYNTFYLFLYPIMLLLLNSRIKSQATLFCEDFKLKQNVTMIC